MSKIGRIPVLIPEGVEITKEHNIVKVKGPKGVIEVDIHKDIDIKVENHKVHFKLTNLDNENGKAFWGLARARVNNAIVGVSKGFMKTLELVGVGYRVEKMGEGIKLAIGYSHPVVFDKIDGIVFELEGNTKIKVSGIDKTLVGQVSANIRDVRPPEPYKGKGIKYQGEVIRRKQGKSSK